MITLKLKQSSSLGNLVISVAKSHTLLHKSLHEFSWRQSLCGKQFYNQSQHGIGRRLRAEAERQRKAQRQNDCRTLNIAEDCNDESQVRNAYIKLAKLYHPDAGTSEVDAERFHQVDIAYKNLLKDFAEFRHNRHKIEGEYGLYYQEEPETPKEEEEGPDIKHTAPQHRQYLSFDGVGSGTPFEREKQYNKYRRAKVAENVMQYRVQQISRSSGEEVTALAKDVRASKKTKTGLGVDRLVEDLIQDSMARGEFDNLSGKGKPLKHSSAYNPYIDFTTHKLNQVLIENGFAPEWILLEKEIREEIRRLRQELSILRHKYSAVLPPEEENEWNRVIDELKPDCDNLNKMITKFNLTVPSLHKQMMTFQLNREAEKAVSTFSPEMQQMYQINSKNMSADRDKGKSNKTDSESFLGLVMSIFKI